MDFAGCMDDLCSRFIINNPYEEVTFCLSSSFRLFLAQRCAQFSSFERVVFQVEQAHWFYEDFYRKRYGLMKYTLERFVELVFHHCPSLQPYAASVDTIYKDFRAYKNSVPVCGCILINPRFSKVGPAAALRVCAAFLTLSERW
jgi:mRNA-decapping enzyme subunit 2